MDARTWNVVQLGIAFMLTFAAFNTSGFIEETVLNSVANSSNGDLNKHAGYYSLSIIYAVFTFSNFLAPPIIGIIGAKWSMVIGAACYCIFMVGFLKLTGWFLYLSSGLVGFGAAILWTGQGNYLTLNSSNETIGRNSGMLWAMMQTCLIAGGIFLYFIFPNPKDITEEKTRLLYTCFSAVCGAGILCLALLPAPAPAEVPEEDRDALVESFSAHNQQVVDGVTDSSREVKTPQKTSLTEDFFRTFRMLKTKNMLLLSVVFMFSGVEMTFWTGIYSTCLSFTNRLNDHSSLIAFNALALGVGQIVGGGVFGIFGHRTNKYGRNPIILLGTVVHLVAFFLIFMNIPMDAPLSKTDESSYMHPPSYPLALVCGLLLGFADSCWNTQIYSILGSLYPEDSAPAFALYKFFQSATACGSFYYGSVLQLHWQLLILGTGSVMAALCYFPVEWDAQTKPQGIKIA